MAIALYEPGLGYYRTSDDRTTRAGDFLTAPETHPIFGAAIARQLDEVHRRLGAPGRFVVRDYGAGSGALGLSILEAVTGQGVLGRVAGSTDLAAALVYVPIEVDRERRDAIVERLTAAGFGPNMEPDLPPDHRENGVTLANELLDALPVHRVVGRADGIRELAVGWSAGRFVEVEILPSSPALEARLAADGVVLADAARAEICLELDPWIGELATGLERGIRSSSTTATGLRLCGPERSGGTLRAAGQRVRRLVGRRQAPGPDRPRLQRRARSALEHGLTDH
jgi:SAM-dependent MidA family methyltransferase